MEPSPDTQGPNLQQLNLLMQTISAELKGPELVQVLKTTVEEFFEQYLDHPNITGSDHQLYLQQKQKIIQMIDYSDEE